MNFEDLTPELQVRARACKTPEELFVLAKEEGVELTDDELAAVSGGGWCAMVCNDDHCRVPFGR